MIAIGLMAPDTPARHRASIAALFDTAFGPLRTGGIFDFADNRIAASVRDEGLAMATDRDFWHIPPIDTLFLQRKFGGVYLLGARLGARVDVRGLLEAYV